MSWTGSDDDGDTLTYRLAYSRDGRTAWDGISPSPKPPPASLRRGSPSPGHSIRG